jgi:trans-AT polyketide synthase/acyltransferase/oxidoreductase domain-containing protein
MSMTEQKAMHWYDGGRPIHAAHPYVTAIQTLDTPFAVVSESGTPSVQIDGTAVFGRDRPSQHAKPMLAWVNALTPDQLGDASFCRDYGVRLPYVVGAMANGIASTRMVIATARGGMIGFFGAAGLSTSAIEAAIIEIKSAVGDAPFGINLIHSPQVPQQEHETVALLRKHGVVNVSASAYIKLTPAIVAYRATGLSREHGEVKIGHRVLAKVSRPEVALQFLNPAPTAMLDDLRAQGIITQEQHALALITPMADDLTAEADSGGHTDNRAAPVLIPQLIALRDRIVADRDFVGMVRIGAAGGLSSPAAIAAAFAAGAAYVVTGTINQACIEAGTSEFVRDLLSTVGATDVTMAPSSDMFEAGVKVQVLKRGTLFAMRANQLYTLYKSCGSIDDIDDKTRANIERTIFQMPLEEVWQACVSFFSTRDPEELTRADKEPKHKMALIFRWYLGLSSRWAITGEPTRHMDAQIWCGPAIGAFNDWTNGSFLAEPKNRDVVTVAVNLMAGAAALTRAREMQRQGVHPNLAATTWTPRKVIDQNLRGQNVHKA